MHLRIAIALDDSGSRTGHFGHASRFEVYQLGATGPRFLERRTVHPFCGPSDPQGGSLGHVLDALGDCSLAVVSAIGPCGLTGLQQRGIGVHLATGSVEDAVASAARTLGTGLVVAGGAA
jgi:nitrogen fixation protein NifB